MEDKRLDSEKPWSGQFDAGLNITKNTQQIIEFDNSFDIQYQKGKSKILLLNNINFISSNGEELLNRGYQHVRYQYTLKEDFLAPEVFSQAQYNHVQKIQLRALLGGGPRFTFFNSDTFNLHVGPLVMYEYEEITDRETINRDWRLSNYISFSLKLSKLLRLTSTTYYQPALSDMLDFRVSHESLLNVSISENFSIKFIYQLLYDTQPPPGIPVNTYTFTNGLSYKF